MANQQSQRSRSGPSGSTSKDKDWSERTAEVVGGTAGRAIGFVSVPATAARRVLDQKGGLPVYVGAGTLAAVGAVTWPAAVGASAGYVALRKWGSRLPEPLRMVTGSDPEVRSQQRR
jgi:hypothetical protein